jgi:hypothetical protein
VASLVSAEIESSPIRKRRHQRRLSQDEVQELIAARRAGKQINDLSAQFSIHRATVQNHLRRAGIEHRRWGGRTLTPDQLQQAGQLYDTGLSLVAVGERFGVDKRYLSRALPTVGFVIRRHGRQARRP